MPPFNPLQNIMDEASTRLFTETELRLLAFAAINEASAATTARNYAKAIAAIETALDNLRALRQKKGA